MKFTEVLSRAILAAVFTAGAILMGASTASMAASHTVQLSWGHYQTRTYKDGNKTQWYLGMITDPSTGKNHMLLKMDFYNAKGELKETKIGLVEANAKDDDTNLTDWEARVKRLKQKGGKVRITPEFAKTPLGKFLTAKGADLVTIMQPSDVNKPASKKGN